MEFGKKRPADCHRRSDREDVMLAASAMAITRSRSVFIADLSFEGAQLGGRDLPRPGDDVVMVAGPVDVMAKVVWRRGDKCGISFEQPLCSANIAQMKQEAGWAVVTGWAR